MEELKGIIRNLNELQFTLEEIINNEENYHKASRLANIGYKLIEVNEDLKDYINQ